MGWLQNRGKFAEWRNRRYFGHHQIEILDSNKLFQSLTEQVILPNRMYDTLIPNSTIQVFALSGIRHRMVSPIHEMA